MSFAQGTPSVNTLINSSNCIVLGNTSSGTALSVQQLGAGNVASFSNAAGNLGLFVSSLGRVGVGGLTAPATPLHVSGQDAILAGTGTGSYSSNVLQLYTGATGTGYYQYSANLQGFNDTVGSVTWKFNTVNNGTSYPNNLVMKNGNVGIGITNPGYVLQVNSAATGSETVAAFLKPSMATGGTFAGIQVGGANATGGAGAMGFLNYGTNASNVFQLSLNGSGGSAININSTGVGIGTTSPIAQLHAYQTNGTGYQLSINNVANAGGSNYSAFIHSDQAYCGGVGGVGQYTYSGASLLVTSYPNNTANNSGYTAYFGTSANDATSLAPQMVIKAATGNVGIGTTSPGAALQVNGTGPIFNGSGSAGPVTKYYNFFGNIPVNSTPAIVFNFSNYSFYVKIIAMQGDLNNSNNVNILTIEAIGGNFYGATPGNMTQLSKVQGGQGPAWSGTVTYGVQSITITPGTSTGGSIWNTRVELVSMAATGAGYVASLSTITQGGATVYTPGY